MVRLHIREFRLRDYEEVARLWGEAGLTPRPGDGREAIERKLQHDPDLFLIVEDDHRIIGTVMGAWDGRRAWIYRLAVQPSRQRTGVGKLLIGELERRLKKKGTLKVNALIYQWNEKSLDFFKALRYEVQSDLVMVGKPVKQRTRRRNVTS